MAKKLYFLARRYRNKIYMNETSEELDFAAANKRLEALANQQESKSNGVSYILLEFTVSAEMDENGKITRH